MLGCLVHSLVASSLLGTNIFRSTLFSHILSLRYSLNVTDQVSLLLKTAGKIIVMYILISIFLDSKLEDKRLARFPRLQSARDFFMNAIVIRWGCSQIFELCHTFRGFISCLVVTSICMLVSRHDHDLSFIRFTSRQISLLATTKASVPSAFVPHFLFYINMLCQLCKSPGIHNKISES